MAPGSDRAGSSSTTSASPGAICGAGPAGSARRRWPPLIDPRRSPSVAHGIAWPLGAARSVARGRPPATHGSSTLAQGVAGFALLLMLAQTLNGATKLLYARGDLDLLLASPLPPRRVLRRARPGGGGGGLRLGRAVPGSRSPTSRRCRGMRALLALYPTLAGAALLAAAGGLALATGLFRLIGPRAHARRGHRSWQGLIGATFTILLQLRRYWPGSAALPSIPRDGPLHDLHSPCRCKAAFGDRAGARGMARPLGSRCSPPMALGLGPAFASNAARAAGAATNRPDGDRGGRGDPGRGLRGERAGPASAPRSAASSCATRGCSRR